MNSQPFPSHNPNFASEIRFTFVRRSVRRLALLVLTFVCQGYALPQLARDLMVNRYPLLTELYLGLLAYTH